jgi:hypothetical protein
VHQGARSPSHTGPRWVTLGGSGWAAVDSFRGPRRILGVVTGPHAVRRLLVALGLAPRPPPVPGLVA